MKRLKDVCKEYLTFCERSKNLSNHTLKAYYIDLKQFQICIGLTADIQKIDRFSIRKFQHYLVDESRSPASIIRKLSCIKSMFRWLEMEDTIEVNPFNKMKISVKACKRLPRNIPAGDIRKIIKSAKAHLSLNEHEVYSLINVVSSIKTKKCLNKLTTLVAIELMLCTGLRVAELTSLKIFDINVREKKIKVVGKGSRERYVFIPDKDLCILVKAYLSIRCITQPETDAFLLNSRGKPASTQFIRKLVRVIAEQIGLKQRITPHMFRHSAACELLESDVDIRFVQRLLGHQSISTTEIYTHITDSLLRQKVSRANVRNRVMKK